MGQPKITKIVLSGGPGGGKDGLRKHLVPWLEGLGYYVVFVEEAATQVLEAGFHFTHPCEHRGDFQRTILRYILSVEDLYADAAKRMCGGKPIVMLCNRGAPEIEAYAGQAIAWEVLEQEGLQRGALFARYDAVIFMVTAADGAPNAYLAALANNPHRGEKTVAEAIERDRLTQKAWLGADHLQIIANTGDGHEAWLEKVDAAKRAIARKLGIPIPIEIERKWLVMGDYRIPPSFGQETAIISQTYLRTLTPGVERRVRQREFGLHVQFYYTTKQRAPDGGRIEEERKITEEEYIQLMKEADPDRRTIQKTRQYFIYEGQYFELDEIMVPKVLTLLELELPTLETPVSLPPFFEQIVEVTGDKQYSNASIARDAS